MSLKLYFDLMSQPSRALFIFLKQCKIPFEEKPVALRKGAHLTPEYEKINPFQKVPVVEHNGFKLTESVAIFRYLCREFEVDDHWYPSSSKDQAKVDEYLEWQHNNTRLHCSMFFQVKFLRPLISGKPARPERVAEFEARMVDTLDLFENVWLKDKLYLTGDKISIADLLGACEIEQPRMAGFEPREGRPRLTAWLNRIAEVTSPHYRVAHKYINDIADKYGVHIAIEYLENYGGFDITDTGVLWHARLVVILCNLWLILSFQEIGQPPKQECVDVSAIRVV